MLSTLCVEMYAKCMPVWNVCKANYWPALACIYMYYCISHFLFNPSCVKVQMYASLHPYTHLPHHYATRSHTGGRRPNWRILWPVAILYTYYIGRQSLGGQFLNVGRVQCLLVEAGAGSRWQDVGDGAAPLHLLDHQRPPYMPPSQVLLLLLFPASTILDLYLHLLTRSLSFSLFCL